MEDRIIRGLIDKEEQTYNVDDIYISCVAKRNIDKRGKVGLTQIVNPQLKILKYASMDVFVDIENNEYYPLLSFGECPNDDFYYIPERIMRGLTEEFQYLLEEKGISDFARLTVKELREIVNEQQHKRDMLL